MSFFMVQILANLIYMKYENQEIVFFSGNVTHYVNSQKLSMNLSLSKAHWGRENSVERDPQGSTGR